METENSLSAHRINIVKIWILSYLLLQPPSAVATAVRQDFQQKNGINETLPFIFNWLIKINYFFCGNATILPTYGFTTHKNITMIINWFFIIFIYFYKTPHWIFYKVCRNTLYKVITKYLCFKDCMLLYMIVWFYIDIYKL